MKRSIISAIVIAVCAIALAGCAKESPTPDPSLGQVYPAPEKGEPGTLQAKIYEFYERYGTHVFYDAPEDELRWSWTTRWGTQYQNVTEGFEEYALRALEFIQQNIGSYTDDFISRNFVYRIFLLDSFWRTTSGGEVITSDFEIRGNDYIFGNIGPLMDEMSRSQWNGIAGKIVQHFTGRYYGSSPVKPENFFNLRPVQVYEGSIDFDRYGGLQEDASGLWWTPNPLTGGVNKKFLYTFRLLGFIFPLEMIPNTGLYVSTAISRDEDFAQYVSFLTTSTRSYLELNFEYFPVIKARSRALAPYLTDVIGMDVVATQNKNCPDDPIPADFFD